MTAFRKNCETENKRGVSEAVENINSRLYKRNREREREKEGRQAREKREGEISLSSYFVVLRDTKSAESSELCSNVSFSCCVETHLKVYRLFHLLFFSSSLHLFLSCPNSMTSVPVSCNCYFSEK